MKELGKPNFNGKSITVVEDALKNFREFMDRIPDDFDEETIKVLRENYEMMKARYSGKQVKHTDAAYKYGLIKRGEFIHEYYGLEGNYIRPYPTDVIFEDGRNMAMDALYEQDQGYLHNVEIQTTVTGIDKIHDIGQYKKGAIIMHHKPIRSIVITSVDPEKCEKIALIDDTTAVLPLYKYTPLEEFYEDLNTIETKINNKEKLNRHESITLAIATMIIPKKDAETVTENVCNLIQKETLMDYDLKKDICFIINIMLGKNIPDKNKREQIRKVIKMSEYMSALDAVVAEEVNQAVDIAVKNTEHTTRATDENIVAFVLKNPENKTKSNQELLDIISNEFKHLE